MEAYTKVNFFPSFAIDPLEMCIESEPLNEIRGDKGKFAKFFEY